MEAVSRLLLLEDMWGFLAKYGASFLIDLMHTQCYVFTNSEDAITYTNITIFIKALCNIIDHHCNNT